MEIWHILITLAVLAFMAEIFTAGFISGALGIGFLCSAIANYWGFETEWQIMSFALGLALTYFLIRPIILKLQNTNARLLTNQDALIGKVGVVSEEINENVQSGRVLIDGDDWKAVSNNQQIIKKGTRVKVLDFQSIILIVEPLN